MCDIPTMVSALRDLGFGVVISTIGPISYKAEYVYWPLVDANRTGMALIDDKACNDLQSASVIRDTLKEAVTELWRYALVQLPNLRVFAAITPPPPPASPPVP